ncbi:MAG: 50S ribosomal protein L11 methyltransferase [Wenzhouxiangella sp.]|jgi:ribosomal protein L11 methyltransferase|nr:50S ribosomal protein L11 methyltransferase [Wenzhouxiangella sp.]
MIGKAGNDWLELSLTAERDQVEAAEDLLFEHGALSVTLDDAGDHPVHEPGPGEMPLWPAVMVHGLFTADTARGPITEAMTSAGLLPHADRAVWKTLADCDWERAWMDRYEPLRFGRDLWICPSHIEPDPAWPVVIRLDPGLAFGSGTHPTTALCLERIDQLDLVGRQVVDFGCGSGVLAIACCLKGAAAALAVDHDPQALAATADNAARNKVAEFIECHLPSDCPTGQAEVVLANILAGPLIELAPQLSARIRPGGELVLSGILVDQATGVIDAYLSQGLESLERRDRDGWVCLVMKRPQR